MTTFRLATLIFGGIVALFFIISFMLPRDYTVERTITVEAPAAEVLDSLLHLETWATWTPWNRETDPTLNFRYEGPRRGVGSKLLWKGEKVGSGSISITQSHPEAGVYYELESANQTFYQYGKFKFSDIQPNQVTVTWEVSGRLGFNPVVRWAGLFIDGSLGPPYQQSLQVFKQRVEHI